MSDCSSDSDVTILVENINVSNILKKYDTFDSQPGASGTKVKSKFDISDESDDEFGISTPKIFKFQPESFGKQTKTTTEEPVVDKELIGILSDDEFLHDDKPKTAQSAKLINILSSSDDDDLDEIYKMKNLPIIPTNDGVKNLLQESDESDDTSHQVTKNTKNKRKSKNNAESKRLEKERLKLEKQKERELKKQEAERNKEIKKALTVAHKTTKPEECVKFITVFLDTNLMSKDYASTIIKHLKELGTKYQEVDQIIPDSITWSRKTQTHLVDDCGVLQLKEEQCEEENLMIIFEASKIVDLVIKKNLSTHIGSVKSIFANKKISLGIYDMDNYFKSKKSRSNKVASKIDYTDVPTIARGDLEYALTELQLLCDCCYRFIDTPDDLGTMVMQFTKSIALIPYKLDKNDKLKQAEWYIEGDNKDTVKVDKDGNGLQRLWQQHLTSFPLARLETAETIISKYPNLSSLMQAYANCSTENEKIQLLQLLPIRRVAGPMSGGRNLGPELSRKMCTFYNSFNGDDLL